MPPGDLAAVAAILRDRSDVAAIILEPTGSSFGQVPLRPEFLHGLRDLTERHGVLLIFDEVITGFRVSRGGAQAAFGVRPDLSTFAKIVAGGLPGAAVAGRRDILDLLDFAATEAAGREKINHPGTFNANPVSAAAGIACLTELAETDANDVAAVRAAELRGRPQRHAGGGRPALGRLWHQLGVSPLHQPEPAATSRRTASIPTQSASRS